MNLKELAQKLNLSQTTVSRALNGYPEVSEATRLRVQQAAERFNYHPSQRARSLAMGRSHAIGHVLPVTAQRELVNPIFGDVVAGASETYTANEYNMLVKLVADGEEERAYRELRAQGMVDGIIVHSPRMDDDRIMLLQDIGLPFVVHGRASDVAAGYSWLDVNNQSAFRRATEFLLDLGHTRIALVNGQEHLDFAHRRRNGYLGALSDRGIEQDFDLMFSDEMTEVNGYNAARDCLRGAAPTAFLVASMISAIGVRRAVHEAGLELGRDVSLVTFDDDLSYLRNGEGVPIFTATRSSARLAGKLLAGMLMTRIQNLDAPHEHRLLEADLVVGSSTGPVRR